MLAIRYAHIHKKLSSLSLDRLRNLDANFIAISRNYDNSNDITSIHFFSELGEDNKNHKEVGYFMPNMFIDKNDISYSGFNEISRVNSLDTNEISAINWDNYSVV